ERVRHRAHAAERASRLAGLVHVGGTEIVERHVADVFRAPRHLAAVLRTSVGIDVEVLVPPEAFPRTAEIAEQHLRRVAAEERHPGEELVTAKQLREMR